MKTTDEDRDWWRHEIKDLKLFPSHVVEQCLDDIDTLKAALEQVEWVFIAYGMGMVDEACPWCLNEKDEGHALDCPRQLALKEGE